MVSYSPHIVIRCSSALLHGRMYPMMKWARMVVIIVGVFLFTLDIVEDSNRSHSGLFLLGLSLVLDGLVGPKQDDMRKMYAPNSVLMGIFMNAFASCLLLAACMFSGMLGPGLASMAENPDVLASTVKMCCLSAVGQHCILGLISHYGSLVRGKAYILSLYLSLNIYSVTFSIDCNFQYPLVLCASCSSDGHHCDNHEKVVHYCSLCVSTGKPAGPSAVGGCVLGVHWSLLGYLRQVQQQHRTHGSEIYRLYLHQSLRR